MGSRSSSGLTPLFSQFGAEAGRDLSGFRSGLFIFASIYPDREHAVKALGRNYAQDFSKITGGHALWGCSDDCGKRLKEYVHAGARTVMIGWACFHQDIKQNAGCSPRKSPLCSASNDRGP